MIEHVEQAARNGQAGQRGPGGPPGVQQPHAGAHADDHVAHLADRVEGQGPVHIALHHRHQARPQQRHGANDQQDDAHRGIRGEEPQRDDHQQVDAQQFVQGAGQQGHHRRRGVLGSGGDPRVQRGAPGLGQGGDQDQHVHQIARGPHLAHDPRAGGQRQVLRPARHHHQQHNRQQQAGVGEAQHPIGLGRASLSVGPALVDHQEQHQRDDLPAHQQHQQVARQRHDARPAQRPQQVGVELALPVPTRHRAEAVDGDQQGERRAGAGDEHPQRRGRQVHRQRYRVGQFRPLPTQRLGPGRPGADDHPQHRRRARQRNQPTCRRHGTAEHVRRRPGQEGDADRQHQGMGHDLQQLFHFALTASCPCGAGSYVRFSTATASPARRMCRGACANRRPRRGTAVRCRSSTGRRWRG